MRVSVVICTYSPEMYDAFVDAAESVLSQTHEEIELVVVVDGSEMLHERAVNEFGDNEEVMIHLNQENRGLSASRNVGVDRATGEVVAFMDDDAVADDRWIEELVATYRTQDALAVGGKMVPEWVAGEPDFLPEEFYWLVGVTHRGFPDEGEVRNTFGSNISFRREVFEELGGFDPEFGRQGDLNLQAEETAFCVEMNERYGSGVYYNPAAVVAHKVFDYRTDPMWLVKRAFWQGHSKGIMDRRLPNTGGEEAEFLSQLLQESVPARIGSLLAKPSFAKCAQLITLFGLTGAVGVGYGYAVLRGWYHRIH